MHGPLPPLTGGNGIAITVGATPTITVNWTNTGTARLQVVKQMPMVCVVIL